MSARAPSTQDKMNQKKGDSLMMEWEGDNITVEILSRSGKATGKYYNRFKQSVGLEQTKWRRQGEVECHMVLVPRERHKELQVWEAKQKELGKLDDWSAVEIVEDEGQFLLILRTWVVWMKPQVDGTLEC